MEVPWVIAILGYICIGCCSLFFLAVAFFFLAPAEKVDAIARRASSGRTDSAQAWMNGALLLIMALAVDGVGCLSFALPGIGEGADLLWAPLSAIAVNYISRGSRALAIVGFIEELLPFTDIIPTATFSWFLQHWPFIFVVMHRAIPSIRAKAKDKKT
eukprot:TRINITY_DN49902_c0_g1_i1.p1 TRINITY_DN49902_c0_g1~~TRINITY_DN49902_c0_g1_i1.p1  ORF type:complete len:158 (+),score=33.69 TRINITY_DN49902_c0_g1_i1:42-515(+)